MAHTGVNYYDQRVWVLCFYVHANLHVCLRIIELLTASKSAVLDFFLRRCC